MFLPIGDEPNPKGVAWVNWALILTNVAIYVLVTFPLSATPVDPNDPALPQYLDVVRQLSGGQLSARALTQQTSAYDLYVFTHGFRPAAPTVATAFHAMFLHAGFFHLAGNMLFLWIYGDNVEARLGRVTYLVGYLVTGLAGNLFHLVLAGASPMPLVGASGAISGVLGFYFVCFPENRVRMLITLFPIFMKVVRIRSRWVLGAYFVLDNLLPVAVGVRSSVAFGAHIGGFVGGVVLALWMRHRDRVVPSGEAHALHADEVRIPTGAHAAAQQVTASLAARDVAGAVALYLAGMGKPWQAQVTASDRLIMADWLAAQGHARAALAVYEQVLAVDHTPADLARADLGAGLVLLHGLGRATDAWQHLMRAQRMTPDAAVRAQAEQTMYRIQDLQKLKFRGQ
jgi:membrane associated rhomboid family serine protease